MDGKSLKTWIVTRRLWWMENWFRTAWWMKNLFRTVWWMKIRKKIRDECQNWSEKCDGTVKILNWEVEQCEIYISKLVVKIQWWKWILSVDRNSNRDPFFLTQHSGRYFVSSDQHMKKLMSLREGLDVMMQYYIRQHFVDRYWLHEHAGGRASWRYSTMRKFSKKSFTYFL